MLYCLFSSLPLHLFRYHIYEYGVSTHSDTGTCTHAHKPFITCPRLWIISALQGQGDAAGKLKSERSAGFDLSVLPNPRDEDRNRPMLSLFKCWWLETFPYLIFNGTYFSSATSKPISSDPCFFPPPSSFSPLHIFPTEYSCHCSSNTSALLTWWVFPVCAKVQHTQLHCLIFCL